MQGARFRRPACAVAGDMGLVSGLAVDAAGARWFHTERGIFRVEPAGWARTLADPGLALHGTLHDALDSYVGGERGLASIDPRKAGSNRLAADTDVLALSAGARRRRRRCGRATPEWRVPASGKIGASSTRSRRPGAAGPPPPCS